MKKFIRITAVVIAVFLSCMIVYNLIYSYDSSSQKMQELQLSDTTNVFYISEKNYAKSMDSIVIPALDSCKVSGQLQNNNHVIAYDYYLVKNPKANIVISHGYTERKEKYREAVYYFLKMGYQVFVPDHYGHGASTRFNSDSSLVYVDNYDIYTNDLFQFVKQIVRPQSQNCKIILFAHSMGGGIAARAIEEYPDMADAAILSAPLMKMLNIPPDFIKDGLSRIMILAGKGARYTLGYEKYDWEKDSVYQPVAPATYCLSRGEYWHRKVRELSLQPSNGASWQLVSVFLKLSHDVVNHRNVAKIKIPILLFQADKDNFVNPKGHFTFANNAKNITFYHVNGAGHEIYYESDRFIIPYFNKIHNFVIKIISDSKNK